MSSSRLGPLSGTLVLAGLSALVNAAAGAVGAAVLQSAGYDDYDVIEAVIEGAIGGAIVGGGTALCCGLANRLEDLDGKQTPFIYIVSAMLENMIGYAIFATGEDLDMPFNKSVAATAVGAAILCLPLAAGIEEFQQRSRRNQNADLTPMDVNVSSVGIFKKSMDVNATDIDLEAALSVVPKSPKK